MRFRQLVVYDIEDNSLRNRVAATLLAYGLVRLQFSVFIGDKTRNMMENLELELKKLIGRKKADCRIFFVCHHQGVGQVVVTENKQFSNGAFRPVEGKKELVVVV
ncbi:MAG: CRISPR-associated endonuclease Cas2 [Candidatus Heimdallarchaeota archaeon]